MADFTGVGLIVKNGNWGKIKPVESIHEPVH